MRVSYGTVTVHVNENTDGEWSISAQTIDGTVLFRDVPYHLLSMVLFLADRMVMMKEQVIERDEE